MMAIQSDFACALAQTVYALHNARNNFVPKMILSETLADGKVHEISDADYRRFREAAQSPVAYRFSWSEQQWDFGSAGPYGFIYAFAKVGGRCVAQKTTLINPSEIGLSIDTQLSQPAKVEGAIRERLESMATSWLPVWRRMTLQLSRGRQSHNADAALIVCCNDDEVVRHVLSPESKPGAFIVRENICFARLDDAAAKWAVMKKDSLVATFEIESQETSQEAIRRLLSRSRHSSSKGSGRAM